MAKKKVTPKKGEVLLLMQGIRFRDCLIISLNGKNSEIFDAVGEYDTIMFPAIVQSDLITGQPIDNPQLKNVRVDHLLTSPACPNIEGVKKSQGKLYFNEKPISHEAVLAIMNYMNAKEAMNNLFGM